MKNVQATGESLSLEKRTSIALQTINFLTFSFFVGHFCPPGSGSSRSKSPDHNTVINPVKPSKNATSKDIKLAKV
jgi:hypothetical protein